MQKTENWSGAKLELLSREEEASLSRRFRKTGDPSAEDRLVRSQLRLAAHMACAYRASNDDFEDLVQQGALGVVEAVRRFDPERGIRLSSYAAWWIRAYQLRYLMANYRLVKLGSTQDQRKIFWKLRTERARLASAGIEAAPEALAAALGVGAAQAEQMARRMDAKEISLDAPGPSDRPSLHERLAAEELDAEERVERDELLGLVRHEAEALREELDGRERALFDARFQDEPPTLAELGQRFGVSRERARQLESRVFGRLRSRVEQRLAA